MQITFIHYFSNLNKYTEYIIFKIFKNLCIWNGKIFHIYLNT